MGVGGASEGGTEGVVGIFGEGIAAKVREREEEEEERAGREIDGCVGFSLFPLSFYFCVGCEKGYGWRRGGRSAEQIFYYFLFLPLISS